MVLFYNVKIYSLRTKPSNVKSSNEKSDPKIQNLIYWLQSS